MKNEPAGTDEPVILSPPAPGDYLPEVIRKKVIETGLTHPATVYPIALGIGSASAGFILNDPLFYLTAMIGLIGPLWAVIQIFFLSDRISKKYLRSLDIRREKYEKQLVEMLRKELGKSYETAKVLRNAGQGLDQLERISRTLKSIREVLEMKLDTSGFTFHRFMSAADQTYLFVLENLKDTTAILKNADSVVQSGTLKAAGRGENTEADQTLALWQEQMRNAEEKFAKNELAIIEMEKISAKASCWRNDEQSASDDMESAIAELREADRIITKVWMSSPEL